MLLNLEHGIFVRKEFSFMKESIRRKASGHHFAKFESGTQHCLRITSGGVIMIEKILERLEEKKGEWLDNWNDASITDELEDCFYADGMSEAFREAIEIVQEVAKKYGNGWIPVEVAMPTEEGWYIVTCEDKEIWKEPMVRELFYYPKLNRFIDNIRYSEHGCNDIMKYDWTKHVTAWKHEDAPYQKGE